MTVLEHDRGFKTSDRDPDLVVILHRSGDMGFHQTTGLAPEGRELYPVGTGAKIQWGATIYDSSEHQLSRISIGGDLVAQV